MFEWGFRGFRSIEWTYGHALRQHSGGRRGHAKGMFFAGGRSRTNLNTIQMKYRFFSPETILGIVVSFLLCSVSASAQSYIGGSFSFSGSSVRSSASTTIRTCSTTFNVAPDFGWFIGDKWAVGIRPTVGFSNTSNNEGAQSKNFSLGINPYARYQLLAHNRFGLWAEADPAISFLQSRSQTRDGVWSSNSHSTAYGVDLLPVLTYQLNRHISLETRLNLFSLYLKGIDSENSTSGIRQHSFSGGLYATTKDSVGTLGEITIGFLYKF